MRLSSFCTGLDQPNEVEKACFLKVNDTEVVCRPCSTSDQPTQDDEMHSDDVAEMTCRFCLDSGNSQECGPLIAPCRCSGSMKYVHRKCLDEWRAQSLNPKTFVQCTTCHTQFRIRYKNGRQTTRPWWAKLAWDIARYLVIRALMFFASSLVLGFMSPAGVFATNPLINHLFGGCFMSVAAVGLGGVMWQLPFTDNLRWLDGFGRGGSCSGGGSSKDGFLHVVLVILVVIGLCMLLWYVLTAIYRMVCEARHEVVSAIRAANERSRRELAKDHIVLDFVEKQEHVQPV